MFVKLCFMLVFVNFAVANYSVCSDGSNNATITSVYANGCDESTNGCQLYNNAYNSIQITFVPAINSTNLYASASILSTAQNGSSPLVPYNWCTGNPSCPLQAGQNISINQNVVLNFTLSGNTTVHFILKGDLNQTIVCLDFTLNFVQK